MIGTDIIEIARVSESARSEAFLRGVFTPNELTYYEQSGKRAETLAGMFCAKEAAAKALGCGFSGFRPCDIEIEHLASGAPVIRLRGKAEELYGGFCFEVSISHCREYATATVICDKKR